jgi:heterotetrameric sarcosine oxidase gamma subunit
MDKMPRSPRIKGSTSDGKLVEISEDETGILTQLAGWHRFEETARAALQPHLLSLPQDGRRPIRAADKTVWRIAPDRALVMSSSPLRVESSHELVVLDLTDARMRLVVEGPGAADLLSRVMALDFSEATFPVGAFAQGALHHVGVLVDRRARDAFDLFIPTTWGTALKCLMVDHLRNVSEAGRVS